MVARADRRPVRAGAGVLGGPAIFPRSSRAPLALDWLLCPVPRDLFDRLGVSASVSRRQLSRAAVPIRDGVMCHIPQSSQ